VTSVTQNVGSIQNKGLEIEISTNNIVGKSRGDFSWTTRWSFSTLTNRITKLTSPIVGTFNRYVGGDFYQFYLVGFAGADPTTGQSLWYTDSSKKQTTNDYTKTKPYNQGSALPKFYSGITNTFQYKGFSFSFQLYGQFGGLIQDNWGPNANLDGSTGFDATSNLPRYYYNNRWQKQGDMGKLPKVVYLGTQSGLSNQMSTRFLYDGDFIRLRDVSLSYQLPATFTNRLRLAGASVYVRANNLYTYIKDKRITFDPEVGPEGQADQNAPIYKTVLVGLNLNF
jgi:hypothetical protein